MSERHVVTLDCAEPERLERDALEYNVTFTPTERSSHGGSEFRIEGTHAALARWLHEQYGLEDEDVHHLIVSDRYD